MPSAASTPQSGLKLQDICRRLAVDYDRARYVLARGVLPPGIEKLPGKGNHRVFDMRQSFMLAIFLKLLDAGLSTTAAKEISPWSRKVQEMAINGGWDKDFAPFSGELNSKLEWYLEIGDLQFVRTVTNANPSKNGLDISPWTNMKTRREAKSAHPVVICRIDFVEIGRQLAAVGD